jgi:DNA replication protein DnaC
MKYQTMEQLSELRLSAMRNEYKRQSELPSSQELSFDERFAQIVTAQANSRRESRLRRLVKSANLSDPTAILADIDYDVERNITKADIDPLSTCDWVREGHNLIVTGPTGVGKTFVLSAFGHAACMLGLTVRSYRTTRLLTDLAIGRGDGSYDKLLNDLGKPDLLILDDFGIKQIDVELSQDLLEVIDDRWRHQKSLGISSQLPVKEWPNVFADLTICDSIMDRVVRNAYRINLKGPSRRPSLPLSEDSSSSEDLSV